MFVQPLFSALPSGVLGMTADFAPLLVGSIVTLGICVLGLVATIGMHDTWRTDQKASTQPAPTPRFPKAA